MNPVLRTKLSIMMFLQYFIWGAWGVVIFTFISNLPTKGGLWFPGGYVGWIGTTLPIGAMISPIVVGLIVDRFFATERVLAVLHIVGAVLLGAAAWLCDQNLPQVREAFDAAATRTMVQGESVLDALKEERLKNAVDKAEDDKEKAKAEAELKAFEEALQAGLKKVRATPEVKSAVDKAYGSLLVCLLGYAVCFMPTITLTNSISFRNVSDPDKYFGGVRVLGTIGWIVAGNIVAFALKDQGASSQPLYLAAAGSLVLGAFCLFLPHTPPSKEHKTLGDALGLPALAMLKNYGFLVFFICSFLVSTALSFYYQQGHPFVSHLFSYAAALQTLGQVTEIFFMLLIPVGLARLGTKWMLAIGYLAWVIRYLTFASVNKPLVLLLGIPIHGVCFDFFFVVSYLYVDRHAPKHLRATAQSMIAFIVLGLGWALGNLFAGEVTNFFTVGAGIDWSRYWLVPMAGSVVAMVLFVIFFRETKPAEAAST